MADDIPEWAVEKAVRLANACALNHGSGKRWSPHDAEVGTQYPLVRSFARYIAEHEDPPVDPIEQAVAEIYERWLANDPLMANDALRMAVKRGIELGKAGEQ